MFFGEQRVGWIALKDLAAVAATVLRQGPERHCECTNRVTATATDEFLAFNKTHGISFDQARGARQAASRVHNFANQTTTS